MGEGESVPVNVVVIEDDRDAKRGGDPGNGVGDGRASGQVGGGVRAGGMAEKTWERRRVKTMRGANRMGKKFNDGDAGG